MPSRLTQLRRVASVAEVLVAALAIPLSAACGHAQTRNADSALAVSIFRESATAGLAVPASSPGRVGLLRRIAAAQVKTGDFIGAMAIAPAVGDWRIEIQTDVACRLLEDRRFDDAHRFTTSLPAQDRDWALAHLASQLANPPYARRAREFATVDTAALVRRGIAVVQEVRSPNARVDALLSISRSQLAHRDTVGALATVRAARAALADIHEADFVSSRGFTIASRLGHAGLVDDAIAILRSLPVKDQFSLAWSIRGWPNRRDPRVQRELRRLETLIPDATDPNVRSYRASAVAEAFRESGDSAAAKRLARYPPIDPETGQDWFTVAARARIGDTVDSLAYMRNVARAIAIVDQTPDPARRGFKAQAYLRLVKAAYQASRDTIRLILDRAAADARALPLGETLRDDILADVARAQLSAGFHDAGLATVNLIRRTELAAGALSSVGPAPGARMNLRERAAVIGRVANAGVRDLALVAVRDNLWYASFNQATADDVAWATALADSLPAGTARTQAQVGIAVYRLRKLHDTVGARTRLLLLLANDGPDLVPSPALLDHLGETPALLVQAGALDEVFRWARALPDAGGRASALLNIGHAVLDRSDIATRFTFSNGPDTCREEF